MRNTETSRKTIISP